MSNWKRTSLELEFAAQNIHEQLHHRVHWRKGVGEKDKAYDDGIFFVEAEGLVEGAVVNEDREESEDVEHMELCSGVSHGAVWPCVGPQHTCAMPNSLVVWLKLQWPSSWPRTATTS